MARVKIEKIRDDIIALRPVYTDTGNATEIWLASGEILLDDRGLKSVLGALARTYAIDLQAQRLGQEQNLHRSGVLPFHLGARRVFIPLKMRRAITENDMVYGYIDLHYLDEIHQGDARDCRVHLTTGQDMELLSSAATAFKSRHMGMMLLESLDSCTANEEEEREIINVVLSLIRCFKEIGSSLQRIEEQIAEANMEYRVNDDVEE